MQLTDVICYALFTVSVTATCLRSHNPESDLIKKSVERRISKRDTAILLDAFPQESVKDKIARVYVKKKAPRGRNSKLRYRSRSKSNKKPYSNRNLSGKYRNPKLPSPSHKKRSSPKSRRRHPNLKPTRSIVRKHPVSNSMNFKRLEPAGFGEPPSAYNQEIFPPKQTYGEPPLDSYGLPIQAQQPLPYLGNPFDGNDEYLNQEYENWMNNNEYDKDTNSATSINHASYLKPVPFTGETPYNYNYYMNEIKTKEPLPFPVEKKKYYDLPGWTFGSTNDAEEAESQVLVGGQYAEPPARYVDNFRPSAPMYMGDGEFSPPTGVVDSASSTISPYVNYKNSNIAFSPQNLNDAFSIID